MKDKINTILLVGLIIVVILLSWRIGVLKNNNQDALDDMKKSIIANDSLKKEKDGQYAKLVDYYTTEKELKNELKKSNEDLYKVIKNQGEKILSLNSAVITLQGKVSEGFGQKDPLDTNKIKLSLKYPDDKDPFINWNGSVDKLSAFYKGDWTFGKLPLQIVMTEEKRGLWNSRLVGPPWLVVDSISVKSLPPSDYALNEPRKIQFMVGGGYIRSLTSSTGAISVGGGVSLFGVHNIVLNATSNNYIGINYYYKFNTTKKKK